MYLEVHPRIEQRHSEIRQEDVVAAWDNWLISCIRIDNSGDPETIRIGQDKLGRSIEMVGAPTDDGWLVYHALTPPTKNMINEIDRIRRNR